MTPECQKQIDLAYRHFKEGKRFLSLDVERTEDGHFHEIGITIVQGARLESFNYRKKKVDRGPRFVFGKTIVAEFYIIHSLILMHAKKADFYVGHSFWHDQNHLKAEGIDLPEKFYCDTSTWGKALRGYMPSLYALTQEYGVGSSQMHCGGNDSRYTAEVFLKMIDEHHTHT